MKAHAPHFMLQVQLEQPKHSATCEKATLAQLVPSALRKAGHPSKAEHSDRNRHPAIAPAMRLQTTAYIHFLTRKLCLLSVAFLVYVFFASRDKSELYWLVSESVPLST